MEEHRAPGQVKLAFSDHNVWKSIQYRFLFQILEFNDMLSSDVPKKNREEQFIMNNKGSAFGVLENGL